MASLTDEIIELAMYVEEICIKDFADKIYIGSEYMYPQIDNDKEELIELIEKYKKNKNRKTIRKIGLKTDTHIYSKAARIIKSLSNTN